MGIALCRPRAGPVELVIGGRRAIEEEVVEEPALRREQGGVDGGRVVERDIGRGKVGGRLVASNCGGGRNSERADVVGEEALQELGGVGPAESDHRAGTQAAGQGAHGRRRRDLLRSGGEESGQRGAEAAGKG